MQYIYDFLLPISFSEINEDEGYIEGQLGNHILTQQNENFDIDTADIVIVGVLETRGNSNYQKENDAANTIRRQLYKLYYWHTDIKIVDIGNIKIGLSLNDSYTAIKEVLQELYNLNKTVVILGGSHDITLAQYNAYKNINDKIEASCIDASINLNGDKNIPAENFLMEMFTENNNILKHYNHIAFQSYFVHPRMLQTIDKLKFDCYRLGNVLDNIEEMEPVLRNSNMLSFDISALKHSDAPTNKNYPNGLSGIEACTLTRFAGMSNNLNSIGFYAYNPKDDVAETTASQIAHMVWYFIDGYFKRSQESSLLQRDNFNEFHTIFAEVETVFLQSKKTNRWWMQMPNGEFVACSNNDYLTAGKNDFPERWLRVQERN
ncbi:MAG: formimidoylglutamase [Ferruginibacter sp.]|nr:formimidoylglutamase [Ferruginibacter sp.]